MCDESPSSEQEAGCHSDAPLALSLLDLPVEILLHICSFLDASTLVHSLSLVCKLINEILNDNSLWKARISNIWPNTGFPMLPTDEEDDLFWKLSCVAIERHAFLWGTEDAMEMLTLAGVHYSTIDGVLLMNDGNTCISAARDRSLVCWSLPNEEFDSIRSSVVSDAHTGWIWDLTSIEDTIYSCSWDRTVKAWSLTSSGLVPLTTYEMTISGALLCVTSCQDSALFAAGSFCKTVLVFDPRSGYSPITRYQPHKRAVMKLAMTPEYILSASEDKTVSVWDQRAGRIMKSIKISNEAYPLSMSMQNEAVYVGDTREKLHILDPKKDFEPVKCYTTEHKKPITGVHLAPGCLITSSLDGTVRITSPTDPPQPLTTLHAIYGEIASIDYLNEVLAVSGTDSMTIWRPKNRASTR